MRRIHDIVVGKAGRIIVLVFSRDAHHFELVSFCEFGIKHVLSRRSGILRKEIVFRSRPFVEGTDEIVFLRFGTLGLFDGHAVDIDDIACVGKAEINNKNTVASYFSQNTFDHFVIGELFVCTEVDRLVLIDDIRGVVVVLPFEGNTGDVMVGFHLQRDMVALAVFGSGSLVFNLGSPLTCSVRSDMDGSFSGSLIVGEIRVKLFLPAGVSEPRRPRSEVSRRGIDKAVVPVVTSLSVGTEINSVFAGTGDGVVVIHTVRIPCRNLRSIGHNDLELVSGKEQFGDQVLSFVPGVSRQFVCRIDCPVVHRTGEVVFHHRHPARVSEVGFSCTCTKSG